MQNAERKRLIRQMSGPLWAGRGTLLSCTLGLGVLVLVLALVPHDDSAGTIRTQLAASTRSAGGGGAEVGAEAHRRHLFEERRARFNPGNPLVRSASAGAAAGQMARPR